MDDLRIAERVIGKRVYTVDNRAHYDDYLVVWVGQSAEEATWESVLDLVELPRQIGVFPLIIAYEVAQLRQPRRMTARRTNAGEPGISAEERARRLVLYTRELRELRTAQEEVDREEALALAGN